ncbi:MAG: hypothetical protein ACOYOB_20180 [Myxococcota bacterium]
MELRSRDIGIPALVLAWIVPFVAFAVVADAGEPSTGSNAPGVAVPNLSPAQLVGEWSVVTKLLPGGTCATAKTPERSVSTWKLSALAGAGITAGVAGDGSFPTLNGSVEGSALTLTGASNKPILTWGLQSIHADSWLRLELIDGKLRGTRRYLGLNSTGRGTNVNYPCFADFTVTGQRVEE